MHFTNKNNPNDNFVTNIKYIITIRNHAIPNQKLIHWSIK